MYLPHAMRRAATSRFGAAVDDRRALAAELERDRREVLGRGGHHDAADRAVAGVEDVVPALVEQRGGLGHAALDDRDRVGVEVLRARAGRARATSARATSDGFSTAALPAASAPTSGASTSWIG